MTSQDLTPCRDWVNEKSRLSGLAVELSVAQAQSQALVYRKGNLYDSSSASSLGFGLRLLNPKGQEGLAYSARGDLSHDLLESVFDEAKRSLEYSPQDLFRISMDCRPDNIDGKNQNLDILDEGIKTGAHKRIIQTFLEDMLSSLRSKKKIQEVLRLGFSLSYDESALITSSGVFCVEASTSAGAGVALIASQGGNLQTYSGGTSSRHCKKALSALPGVSEKVARIASGLLGAKTLPSGSYALVFDPWVAEEVISLLASTFCADNVQRGKSPWKGKIGQAIASPLVSLIDNGRLPKGTSSFLWDDEGLPTRETILVKEGRLQGFLYDGYTARRDGTKTTGNASRGFRSSPSPGPWNLYLEAGKASPQEILRKTKRGIYLVELMGLHTVDVMTGDFSLGASGFFIENGEIAFPVEKLTVAGNLYEMLKIIDLIGNDLEFHGSIACPTIRVESLSVGGFN